MKLKLNELKELFKLKLTGIANVSEALSLEKDFL
jgi:hypothetical protein